MKKPLVTIAIPTYNRANGYLIETLESALSQSYEEIEIIVSDNASGDHTHDVLGRYSDARLIVHHQKENLGQRRNMNFLLEQAKGDYFLMLHDDDRIDPDFVEVCMNAAGFRTGFGLILTGSRVIDAEGKFIRQKENNMGGAKIDELILNWYRQKIQMFFCCSLFGTEALRMAGGFEDQYNKYDDVAAEFKCAASHGRVDIREVKADFREHKGSVTSASTVESWCNSAIELLTLAEELAPGKKTELRKIGRRTSADRVYRYAAGGETRMERVKSYYTVMRKFNFRYLPV